MCDDLCIRQPKVFAHVQVPTACHTSWIDLSHIAGSLPRARAHRDCLTRAGACSSAGAAGRHLRRVGDAARERHAFHSSRGLHRNICDPGAQGAQLPHLTCTAASACAEPRVTQNLAASRALCERRSTPTARHSLGHACGLGWLCTAHTLPVAALDVFVTNFTPVMHHQALHLKGHVVCCACRPRCRVQTCSS